MAYLDASESVRPVILRRNCLGYDSIIRRRRSEARPTPFLPLLLTLLELAGPRQSEHFFPEWASLPVALGSTDLGAIRQLA